MSTFQTLNPMEQKALAAFKKPERFEYYTHDALVPYVQYVGADTCLRLACLAGQAFLAQALVENFNADIQQTRTVSSDRHAGTTIQLSLLDDTLEAYATGPINRNSSVTNDGYAQTVKYLLQNGAPVQLNKDPLESPILMAHLLACPNKAKEKDMPHFDLAAGTYLEEGGSAFPEPYRYLCDTYPKEVEIYQNALAFEQKRLKAQFAASQDRDAGPEHVNRFIQKPKNNGLDFDL